MTERFQTPDIKSERITTAINLRAKEGQFNDSEIFGITDDLLIVLTLLKTQGIQIPSDEVLNCLREELTACLGNSIAQPPLYLH